jgi:hypothetical protein
LLQLFPLSDFPFSWFKHCPISWSLDVIIFWAPIRRIRETYLIRPTWFHYIRQKYRQNIRWFGGVQRFFKLIVPQKSWYKRCFPDFEKCDLWSPPIKTDAREPSQVKRIIQSRNVQSSREMTAIQYFKYIDDIWENSDRFEKYEIWSPLILRAYKPRMMRMRIPIARFALNMMPARSRNCCNFGMLEKKMMQMGWRWSMLRDPFLKMEINSLEDLTCMKRLTYRDVAPETGLDENRLPLL